MRIAIIGQQDFGKATLEAFLARGDEVAAVFCAPEKSRPDPLRLAAEARGVPVHQLPRLTDPAALEAMRGARAQIGVMAYVTQFAPQEFCNVPTFGTIQFHPSLLPLHRGASSMSWSIICGRRETGFSIFRPTDGLDEGPVLLTRAVPIEEEDTLGSLYFGKIFPMGVAALVEMADLVVAGRAPAIAQYEPRASYEGRKLFLFDCRKRLARTFSEVKGKKLGEVVAVGDTIVVHGQGGFIEARRVRWADGKKLPAAEAGLTIGAILGT